MKACQLIVMGASLGGMAALDVILRGLPATLRVPVALVQHRRPGRDQGLVAALQQCTALQVVEPEDKEPMLPGRVYLAPADYHLLVEDCAFALSTAAPICFARPSIDALFESAAAAYQDRVVAVALTCSNEDGAAGVAAIEAAGGLVLIQDPATAESPVLPRRAMQLTRNSKVLKLPEIAPLLLTLVGQRLST